MKKIILLLCLLLIIGLIGCKKEVEETPPTAIIEYRDVPGNCTQQITINGSNCTQEIIMNNTNCTIIHETNSSYVLGLIRQLDYYESREEQYINNSAYNVELNRTLKELHECNDTLEQLREWLD